MTPVTRVNRRCARCVPPVNRIGASRADSLGGFSVVDTGTEFEITKVGDKFFSSRVDSTDPLIEHTCMGMISPPPSGEQSAALPLLHPTGLLLLAVGLLLAGILIIRRKAAA